MGHANSQMGMYSHAHHIPGFVKWRKPCRSGMLFMPDISMVKYETTIGLPAAVPSSNAEMSGNDKAVA
jgi:hypothetical protein